MNTNIVIREFQQEEAPFLESLMKEFGHYISSIDPLKRVYHKQGGAKFFLDKMIKETGDNNGKVFVALNKNKIVGFIGGYIKSQSKEELMETIKAIPGYVSELFVQEKFRDRGIGLGLMNKIEKYFISQGCDIIRTVVFSPNKPARSLYEKLGFHERDISLIKVLKKVAI